MSSIAKTIAAGTLLLGFGIGSAQATPISSLFFEGETNQLSDNSGEEQEVDLNSNSLLDVGDTLRGTFDIGTLEDLSGGGGTHVLGAGSNNFLSGIFEIEVDTKTFVNNGADGVAGTGDDVYDFTFIPHAAFATEFGAPTGAMVLFFEDDIATGTPYNRNADIATAEATATDGILRWVLGMGEDADELWAAEAPQDPTVTASVSAGTAVGAFNFQLSILLNTFGVTFGQTLAGDPLDDGLIDANASGEILGSAGTSGQLGAYETRDNVDIVVDVAAAVPEPGTLALLGLGLVGLGAVARRRRAG